MRQELGHTKNDEAGFTLNELTIAMAILAVVVTITLQVVTIFTNVEVQSVNVGKANETAAMLITNLRQDISSANVIFDPANEGSKVGTNPDGSSIPAGFALRVFSQPDGTPVCMQWRLLDTGTLQMRSWPPTYPTSGTATGWSTLATGMVNSGAQTPFVLDSGSNFTGTSGGRLLDLDFWLQGGTGSKSIEAKTSIAARNAEFYASSGNDCTTVPSP